MKALLLMLITCVVAWPAQAKYGGGSGTADDPYQIATARDLMSLGHSPGDYDQHFIMTADIDLDPNLPGRKVFTEAVIAPYVQGVPFTGVFSGNGHTILHLTIKGSGYLGLFGQLLSGAEVRNVGVVDVNVAGSGYKIGGLVGRTYEGSVIGCYSTGAVTGTGSVGGLVGDSDHGIVTQCYSAGAVKGNSSVGGLMGSNQEGFVSQCCSTGAVSGGYSVGALVGSGGLVGFNGGDVINCYSTGTVSGAEQYAGGLVGFNDGTLTHCYSTGRVSGNYYVGGLAGVTLTGRGTACFWDIGASGQAQSACGTSKTTAEMQTAKTFLNAGWDFVGEITNGLHEVWQMPQAGGYPVLAIFNGHKPPKLQGRGTVEDAYLIHNALELGAMCYYSPCVHYRLAASIDLSGVRWSTAVIPWLTGTFDGDGHTITHLTIAGGGNLGLLGVVGSRGEVKELGVVAANIRGSSDDVGGLVGHNDGHLARCYTTGAVNGVGNVGGLAGDSYGTVTACYSLAQGTSSGAVGGLVASNAGTVTNSYSVGAVTSTANSLTNVGGLAGYSHGTVLRCVWDMQTSRQPGSAGGVGLTTAEMMDPNMLGLNGFADDPNWVLDAGRGYPRLAWEGTPGAVIPEPDIDWLEGTGTAENPYRIDTADQLVRLGKAGIPCEKHLVLGKDIDLNPNLPNGRVFAQAVVPLVKGVFDGNGHRISHLTVRGGNCLGLFGQLASGGEIKNVGVAEVIINSSSFDVGGLVGYNNGSVAGCYATGAVSGLGGVGGLVGSNAGGGSVTQCHSTSTVQGTYHNVGGLVGWNYGGHMTQCYSTGAVSGKDNIGGLMGSNQGGLVSQCYSTGAVRGIGTLPTVLGGLVGFNSGDVISCYCTGMVGGAEQYAGGLAGINYGTLTHCYSTGWVGGNKDVGGLVGSNQVGLATACFWNRLTSRRATSAGGTGKTTTEMQMAKTFLDAGWDFAGETANGTEDIWWILEGKDYPRLWWELPAAK